MNTKPNSLNQIEMKDDGNDAERFGAMLRKVANVPKEEIKKAEEREKKKAKKNARRS